MSSGRLREREGGVGMWPLLAMVLGVVALFVVGVVFLWRPLKLFGRHVQLERAQELFRLQRERLEAQFTKVAAASGKPRGLRWKECQWETGIEFVRDKQTGHIAALVGVTIQFEAIEGGDMEGVPAVAHPKTASAVFFFHHGHWQTAGRALFNMNPHEAIAHFNKQYERVGP